MEPSIDIFDDIKLSIAMHLLNDFPSLFMFTLVNKKFYNFPWHVKHSLSFSEVQGWKENRALEAFIKLLPQCKSLEELQFSQRKIKFIRHEDSRVETILSTLSHQLVRLDLGSRSPIASEQCPSRIEFPRLRYLRMPASHTHFLEAVIGPETLRNLEEIECTHLMLPKLKRSENLKRLTIVRNVAREFGGPAGLKDTIVELSELRSAWKQLLSINIIVEENQDTRHYVHEMLSVLEDHLPISLNGHSAWIFASGVMTGTNACSVNLRQAHHGTPEQRARDLILLSTRFDSAPASALDIFIDEIRKAIDSLPSDSWQLAEHLCCMLLLRSLLHPLGDAERSATACSEFESLVGSRSSSPIFVVDLLFIEYAPQMLKALPSILSFLDHWNTASLFKRYSATYSVSEWMDQLPNLFSLISHPKFDKFSFRPLVVDLIVSFWRSSETVSEQLWARIMQIAKDIHAEEPLKGTIGMELQQLAPLALLRVLSSDCELMETFSLIFLDAPYLVNYKNALRMFEINRGNGEEFRPFAVLLAAHSEAFGDSELEHQQYLDEKYLCSVLWRVVVSQPIEDVERAAHAVVAVAPQIPDILQDYLTGRSGVLSDIYNAPEKREIIRGVVQAEFGHSFDLQHAESDLFQDYEEDEGSDNDDSDAMSFSDAEMDLAEDDNPEED